jgi:hypothetical protein
MAETARDVRRKDDNPCNRNRSRASVILLTNKLNINTVNLFIYKTGDEGTGTNNFKNILHPCSLK